MDPTELTPAECDLIVGLLAGFRLQLAQQMRHPDVTERGREEYQESVALADSARCKLLNLFTEVPA